MITADNLRKPEWRALTAYLVSSEVDDRRLVASWLLHTELHCAAHRHPDVIDLESVGIVLDTVALVDLSRGDLLTAGALPSRLRSNDAIHLAVALRVGVDEMITYDAELHSAAAAAGLAVVAPS
jgi:hypothetical protein